MDITIVIVNWNTEDLLAQCLHSLEENVQAPQLSTVETFVVDNASTDGSVDLIRKQFPWVQLIVNRENAGFARANNQALKLSKGDKLLLLNPDAELTHGAVELLSGVLDSVPESGIVGAHLLNSDGTDQRAFGSFPSICAEIPRFNRWLNRSRQGLSLTVVGADHPIQPVDWVSGACLMLKRETYEDIGGLDEHFWLYTEEADWCYRARKANYAVFHVPDAKVYHHARAASGQRYELTMLHFYQSRVRFAHKHYGAFHAWLLKEAIRLKTTIWVCAPNRSPLREAYADLSPKQIADAYRTLRRELMESLPSFLARNWMNTKTSTAKYEPGDMQ